MLIKPYFSIDIETTGLDINSSQVLEIALVYDDGISLINDLPSLRVIRRPETSYYEFYAMSMHSDLLKEINQAPIRSSTSIVSEIRDFIGHHHKGKDTPSVAGKNASGFDLPILKNNGIDLKFKHRVIDVGSMYIKKFGYVPSLDEINKLIGNTSVSHKALDDAFDVVRAIRYIMEN